MTDEIVIAGGGLAGGACACWLARAGRQVTVVEREAGPVHKICGEFLSNEAQAYLGKLGVDVSALGGPEISHMQLTTGTRAIETPLPFRGIGISRRVLDEAVLTHAERAGAKVLRGRVIANVTTEVGISVNLADGEMIRPTTLFLATGKHELRGLRRDAAPAENLVGFKMYFALNPLATRELTGRIELILFRDGYAGMQMVEAGQANLCLLIDRARLQAVGGKWPALLEDLSRETPLLARLLDGAKPLLEQPLTIYRVPYGFIHRPQAADSVQIYRLGDQAGVIPSFTGDGMAIALHSVAAACSMFLNGDDATAYHRRLARDISGQIQRAQLFYQLANARATKRLFFPLLQALPGSLKLFANLTRVPERARISAM
jgi:flavin-dependent dehydrogenase